MLSEMIFCLTDKPTELGFGQLCVEREREIRSKLKHSFIGVDTLVP